MELGGWYGFDATRLEHILSSLSCQEGLELFSARIIDHHKVFYVGQIGPIDQEDFSKRRKQDFLTSAGRYIGSYFQSLRRNTGIEFKSIIDVTCIQGVDGAAFELSATGVIESDGKGGDTCARIYLSANGIEYLKKKYVVKPDLRPCISIDHIGLSKGDRQRLPFDEMSLN